VTRQPGAFGAHPPFEFTDERPDPFRAEREPLRGGDAVDLALDREDLVNAAHGFDGQRRFAEIGQHEEFAPAMAPARRLGDRAGPAPGIIEIAKAGISIGLEDPGIAGEMPVGVLAAAVARVEEQRGGRVGAGERPIVPDISLYPADDSLVFGQHRHGRVVAVQAFGGEHVLADQVNERRQARRASADPVRQEPALAKAGVDTSSSMPSRA